MTFVGSTNITKVGRPINLGHLVTVVTRRIQEKYDTLGGAAFLGEIERKEGNAWFCQLGCICYNSQLHEAFEIHGDIYRKWLNLGGLKWGVPSTDELPTSRGDGRFNFFNDGSASIHWTPRTGAHAVWGDILKKWAQLNWENGPMGYPVTDETATPDGIGRFNHFENGGSIYWTPDTGANAVWGDIRKRWESLGWERSYLGYPTSDEVDFPEGGRANTFQNGGIYWWSDTGAIDLRDVIVHYTGLHCFGETDWDQSSDSDEPYVILSMSTPERAATLSSQTYEDVDGGEARPDLIELYRGKPYGINLSAVLMENDFGDPNVYRADVEKVVNGVHAAGTVALGLIPIVGPIIAAVAGPGLGTLMPAIAGAVNDLFDFGDDRIGGATVTLSAKQMVLLAARTNNSTFKGIGFKAETPLIAGHGASYKIYFGIVPA
jgi:LGFP repeat